MENTTLKIGKIERTYPKFEIPKVDFKFEIPNTFAADLELQKVKEEIIDMEYRDNLMDVLMDSVESLFDCLSYDNLHYIEVTVNSLFEIKDEGKITVQAQNHVLEYLINYIILESHKTISKLEKEAVND